MHFYRPILGALLICLNIINLPHNKRGRERAKKRLYPQTALTLTLLLGGLSYTAADTLNMPLTFEAWQHYTLSSQGHEGHWEQTADGIRLYGSASGNGLMSKDRFDFRGTETLIKWQVNSFDQYSALLPHLKSLTGSALLSERFTTHHTEPGATLISDKTWYYTKITVNRDSTYTAITAQDDYDFNGGFVIHSQFGTFNGAQDGYVAIYLADNDAGQLAYLTLGDVKITSKSATTFSSDKPIDFNQAQGSAIPRHRQGTRQEPKTIEFDYDVIASWKYYTKFPSTLRVTATESQCDKTETHSLTIPFEQEIILNHSNYGDCSIASTQYRIEGGEWTRFTNGQTLNYGGKLEFQIQASGVSSCQTTCTVTTIATFFYLSSTQEPHHYTGKNSVSDSIFSNVTELRKIDVATPYDGGIVRELKCDDNTNNPDVAFKCEQVEGNVVISAYYIRPVAHFNILPLYDRVEPLTVELNASDSYAGTGNIKSYEWTKSGEPGMISQPISTLDWHKDLKAGNHKFCLVVVNDKDERSEKVCETVIVKHNQSPIASFYASPSVGNVPLRVKLNPSGSYDPEGSPLTYHWTVVEDNRTFTGPTPEIPFDKPGNYTIKLVVTDDYDLKSTEYELPIIVEPRLYMLTVSGSGQGKITASGIECRGHCDKSLTENTKIALTAKPDQGFTFANWSGACSGSHTCTITMTQDQNVMAHFKACEYQFNPTNTPHNAEGGSGSVSIIASNGCPWTVTSDNDWLSITSSHNGSGNGPVSYLVAPNSTLDKRDGKLSLVGKTTFFSVQQQAPVCTYTLDAKDNHYNTNGGNGNVTLTASYPQCPWTLESDHSWLKITSGQNGVGNSPISYSVEANSTLNNRSGKIGLVGQTTYATVSQDAPTCSYQLSPTESQAYNANGGNGSVNLTVHPAQCTWTALNDKSWLTITSNKSGAGNASITYSVADNATLKKSRMANLTIEDKTFKVIQKGNQPPIAQFTIESEQFTLEKPLSGKAPLTVSLNAQESKDPEGDPITDYDWNSTGGQELSKVMVPKPITFNEPGKYLISLVVTDNKRAISTVEIKTITVEKRPVYTLFVNKIGNGLITGNSNTGQVINCGTDCSKEMDENTKITLTAIPDAGSSFVGWSEHHACQHNNPICQINMGSHNQQITASFNAKPIAQFTYSISREANGLYFDVELDGTASIDIDDDQPTYKWSADNGQSAVGKTSSLRFYDLTASYSITLTVTDKEGLEDKQTQNVTLLMLPEEFGLNVHRTETIMPLNGIAASWSSNDESVVSVDNQGNVTGIQIGEASITATDSNGYSATTLVNVVPEDYAVLQFVNLKPYYKVEDMLDISLELKVQVTRSKRVDLWVAINMPDKLVYMTNLPGVPFSLQAQPFQTSLESVNKAYGVFKNIPVPSGIGGEYTLYALVVDEGKNPLSEDEGIETTQRSNLVIRKTTLAKE